jgi:hypothetical protein
MPGKTPMWGNPMRERERERDLLFSFRKVHISNNKYNFQQEKSTYNTLKQPPKFCLEKCAKSVLLYDLPRKYAP